MCYDPSFNIQEHSRGELRALEEEITEKQSLLESLTPRFQEQLDEEEELKQR